MGKRILSLLLSIIMILSLAPVTFAESSNVTASTEATTVNAGDSFTVTLSNKAMTVSTFAAGLRFDNTKLEVISIVGNMEGWIGLEKTSGPFPQVEFSTKSTIDEANANGTVGVGLASQEDNAYKATTIYTVTFKVIEGVWGTVNVTAYEDSSGASEYKADSNTVTITVPCKHGGTVNTTQELAATCEQYGQKAYYQCDICKAYFATYSSGTLSDSIEDLDTWLADENGGKIKQTGHKWSSSLMYDESGHYYKCTNAGCNAIINKLEGGTVGQKVAHTYSDDYWVYQEQGKHALKCDYCGYIDVNSKADHQQGSYRGGTDGHQKYCPVCDTVYDTTILPHTYNEKILITEENKNKIHEQYGTQGTGADYVTDINGHAYKCDACAHIEKTAHNFVLKNGQDPTCIAVGVKEYYKCEGGDHPCGLYFEKTGETYTLIGDETALESWKQNGGQIPATGNHSFDQSNWENNEQNHWHKCTTKDCNATDSVQAHNFVYDNSEATTDAEHTLKCSVCGYTKTENHKWVDKKDNANHWKECSVCGKKKEEAAHIYNYVSKDEETHTYACSCGQTITENHSASGQIQNNVNGHWYVCKCGQTVDYSAHNYEIKDCTQEGTCTVCQYKRAAREHMWNEGEQTKAPTCTEKGETKFTCTSCQETKTEANDALGHDYTNQTPTYTWTENNTKCEASVTCKREGCTHAKTEQATVQYVKDTAATCTEHEKGHYKATFTNAAFSEQNTAKNSVTDKGQDALTHTYGTPVYEWNGDLCTAKKTCTREGCTNAQEGHIITETKQGTYVEDTPATCVAASTGYYEVEFTGESFTKQTENYNGKIGALGHNWSEEWEKNESEHWHKCLRTGCTEKTLLVAHNYTTYVGSTETQHTYKCVCGATETTNHNHNGNGGNLKKDETGHWYVCSCGYEKLGFEAHTFDTNDCTKAGTCTKCGYVRPAGTHSWGTPEQTKAPTCTTAGTNKYTCKSCSATETRDDIPALGHVLESHSLAATCTVAGYKTYYTCTRDDCACKGKYYTDSALTASIGDGTLDTWKAEGGAGYIAALGHSFTLTSSKAATCTINGEKVYTCDRCKETKTENIIAHHTYDANGVCTVNGCSAKLEGTAKENYEQAITDNATIADESGKGGVNTPAANIINAVSGTDMQDIFTKLAEEGTTLDIVFEVKEPTAEQKKEAESIAESSTDEVKSESKGGEVNAFAPIEIDLSMVLNSAATTEIHNLSQPIEIAVAASDTIKNFIAEQEAKGEVVECFMLRIHGEDTKEVSVLKVRYENGKLIFSTDKLSTFVPMIVISDPEPEERPHSHGDTIVIGKRDNKEETKEVEENPNTGAPVPSFGIAFVVLGAASIAVSKKRK